MNYKAMLNHIPSSTQVSATGHKTRHFSNIANELAICLRIHSECGSRLNGVSLEFTGEMNEDGFSVTECLGGSMGLDESELCLRYQVSSSVASYAHQSFNSLNVVCN